MPEYKVTSINSNSLVREKTLLTVMNKLLSIHKYYPSDVGRVVKKISDLYHIPEVASIEEYSISVSNSSIMKK